MAPPGTNVDEHGLRMESALGGLLALLVDSRERALADQKDAVKTEVLLHRVGVSVEEISVLLDKKQGAVRKTIQRARSR